MLRNRSLSGKTRYGNFVKLAISIEGIFYIFNKIYVHLFLIGLPLCIDTEDIQVIRIDSNVSHITRKGLVDSISKRITTRSLTYLTKIVQVITKNITSGNRLYSTRMYQTANITKHFTTSDIPLSTMTGKNESSKSIKSCAVLNYTF